MNLEDVFMTVEESRAFEEMLSDLREEAQWIGEEGAMCAFPLCFDLRRNRRRLDQRTGLDRAKHIGLPRDRFNGVHRLGYACRRRRSLSISACARRKASIRIMT